MLTFFLLFSSVGIIVQIPGVPHRRNYLTPFDTYYFFIYVVQTVYFKDAALKIF